MAELIDSLPDGAQWIAFDLSLGDELEVPIPADGDPKGELRMHEAAAGDVQKIGTERVHGVSTTRYRGTVDASENAEQLREMGAKKLASYVEDEGKPAQVEAWIDADGLVRRMRFLQSQPSEEGEEPMTVDMRMDFIEFGPVPEIEVPPSSEVFDATSLAQKEIEG